jgi:hypothetical protein
MQMPLAVFDGTIKVGTEKTAFAEEITLTFGYVPEIPLDLAPATPVDHAPGTNGSTTPLA